MKTKMLFAFIIAVFIALIPGCSKPDLPGEIVPDTDLEHVTAEKSALSAEDMFSSRDLDDSDDKDAAVISFSGESAKIPDKGVLFENGVLTVSKEGTYKLSGNLSGTVKIDADKKDKIRLILSGVSVSSGTSAALYVKSCDKLFITLEKGTENVFESGDSFINTDENNIDAAVFSKEDLTVNGEGALSVLSPAGHGIVSKDDLKIAGGLISVSAVKCGLCANDSVRIRNAVITVNAGTDCIRSENKEDASLGFVFAESGKIELVSPGDGIYASGEVMITGGEFSVSGKGNDPVSSKGIKSTKLVSISGGVIAVEKYDDGIHSAASVLITGGDITVSSGDDGIHADSVIEISGGKINITESYEGIEANNITVSGGEISVTATDDGINAAGGADESGFAARKNFGKDSFSGSGASVSISGGSIRVNASGDGLDSNGSVFVSGGITVISGPTDNGNAALDYDSGAVITGGVFIAAGSTGMAQNFGMASTQVSFLVKLSGKTLDVKDADGKVLFEDTFDKKFACAVVSLPEFETGKEYSFVSDSESVSATARSVISNSGGIGKDGDPGGGRGGFPGGEPGGFPGGDQRPRMPM